ncbi:MAG: hypothetical protein HYY15_05215 [Candidatus Omnitrophica bacterium]|nr:hypothetical protein [Candidatus Omnitrophota bacterium]
MKLFRTLVGYVKQALKIRIAKDCYIVGGTRDSVLVEFKGRKIEIFMERFPGKPSILIYPSKDRKWLPPHEHEAVSDADYDFIVKTVVGNFEKYGETVEYL